MKCQAGMHEVVATILISSIMSYTYACFYEARIEKHFVFPAIFFTRELLLMMVCEFIACVCVEIHVTVLAKNESSAVTDIRVFDRPRLATTDRLRLATTCGNVFFGLPIPSNIKPWQGKECAQELWRISLTILRRLFGFGIELAML